MSYINHVFIMRYIFFHADSLPFCFENLLGTANCRLVNKNGNKTAKQLLGRQRVRRWQIGSVFLMGDCHIIIWKFWPLNIVCNIFGECHAHCMLKTNDWICCPYQTPYFLWGSQILLVPYCHRFYILLSLFSSWI